MLTEAPADLRAAYENDGFCLARDVIPPDLVTRAVEGMELVRAGQYDTGREPEDSPWKPGDDPDKFCKIEMAHVASRALTEVVTHPALGEAAGAITGADWVQAWWLQMLQKPPGGPGSGTNVGWHQDRQYWKVFEDGSELFTAWVALSDVTADAGPVRFVRGSHRWGLLDQGDFFEQSEKEQVSSIKVPEGQTWDEVPAILSPGSVSFHHNLTYHGSGPNTSSGPRRSLAIHLRTNRSTPVPDPNQVPLEAGRNLVRYLDDPVFCPIIYRRPGT